MAELILLAPSAETAEALRERLAARIESGAIAIRVIAQPLRAAIEAIRDEVGNVPIGVAARSRPEALEAIEAGADESMAIDGRDPADVLELIDRTRARGRIRAEGERERVDVAHAEKLAALGTLVAGVAHEINNPLTVIALTLDVFPTQVRAAADAIDEIALAAQARRGLGPDDVVRLAALARAFGGRDDALDQLEQMRGAAETILDVVKDLRVFARADDTEVPQALHLPQLVAQLLRLVGREMSVNAIVERDFGDDVPEVVVPPTRLTQVLTNVLVNATHALREVARDVHRVRITLRADDDAIALSVSDTGPGIPPHAIERIFDPFYTTKRASLGTGLGLSISRNLMRKMGGDLLVESVYGEGATFIVIIPRPSEAELRAARRRKAPAIMPAGARTSVLLVEEDAAVLRAYSRVLGPRFDLLLASDSQEAIEMIASGSRPDVVVADLGLSPFDGAHLYSWLGEHRAELAPRVVFVASETGLPRHRELLGTIRNDVLSKPTPAANLIAAIESASRR